MQECNFFSLLLYGFSQWAIIAYLIYARSSFFKLISTGTLFSVRYSEGHTFIISNVVFQEAYRLCGRGNWTSVCWHSLPEVTQLERVLWYLTSGLPVFQAWVLSSHATELNCSLGSWKDSSPPPPALVASVFVPIDCLPLVSGPLLYPSLSFPSSSHLVRCTQYKRGWCTSVFILI